MPKLSPKKDHVPAAFCQKNQARAQRTVDLTRQAITRLKAEGRQVTLAALAEATRKVDESGQGVASRTILRNPDARELFHQQSAGYQTHQEHVNKIKRRRSHSSDVAADYRGLRPSDLIAIIGQLQQTIAELRTQQSKLQAERDATNQNCQALREQNTRQLAALTNLKTRRSR